MTLSLFFMDCLLYAVHVGFFPLWPCVFFMVIRPLQPDYFQHVAITEPESCLLSQKKHKLKSTDLQLSNQRGKKGNADDTEICLQRCLLALVKQNKGRLVLFVRTETALILSWSILLTSHMIYCCVGIHGYIPISCWMSVSVSMSVTGTLLCNTVKTPC